MKMFQIICHCGDGNFSLTISESEICFDSSITAQDKESILALNPYEAFTGSFISGKPYTIQRLY